jgi:cation diffusion facilitator CzcD-associated flavoprotein CzcO
VEWNDERSQYLVTLEDGSARWFDVVATAVGMLNVPRIPAWPGLESFRGDVMHSARWDKSVDLTGKRVAVVGGGASAAQIVPGLQAVVSELLSFQREPGWVFRKGDRDYTQEQRQDLNRLGRRKRERLKVFRGVDKGLKSASEPDASVAARTRGETFLDDVFGDRPELRGVLEPSFQPRCKRNVLSDTFYPALAKPNVRLVHRSVESVTPEGVVDDHGHEHRMDAIVLATGFEAANFLSTLEVTGRDGRRLHEVWGDDPQGFLGITMPGFPNFYMLYGPNTHGTVVSFVLERQAEFVARDVRRLARKRGGTIEVTEKANTWFQGRLQRAIAEVPAWKSGCHNFYLSRSGRNVVQWPWSHGRYWLMSRALRVWSSKHKPLRAAQRAARDSLPATVATTKEGAAQ